MQKRHQTAILWIRQCLRLADNPALVKALELAETIIPVYIHAPREEGCWEIGAASKWWLHNSLQHLQDAYQKKSAHLILRQGNTHEILGQLIQETGATLVVYDKRLEPHAIQQACHIETTLKNQGVTPLGVFCNFLFSPDDIKNKQGQPFKVFTPFYKTTLLFKPKAFQTGKHPLKIPFPHRNTFYSLPLIALDLLPQYNWANRFSETGLPGEAGAWSSLMHFVQTSLGDYPEGRDRPDSECVSKLSPALHYGEISPRQIANALYDMPESEVYYRQLIWREFAHYILYHFPYTQSQPFQKPFETFAWQDNTIFLNRWQRGETGYPIVDAGMRELWTTGWMHNRVRMIVASFLTKDLLIHWQNGAQWFWDTLVDADLANNTMGWQWVAGCGVDAAPYFRIFNPVLQAEKFDPMGEYVRKWIPELGHLPNNIIHKPWNATLGMNYPPPIVDHAQAKLAAMNAYQSMRAVNKSNN